MFQFHIVEFINIFPYGLCFFYFFKQKNILFYVSFPTPKVLNIIYIFFEKV